MTPGPQPLCCCRGCVARDTVQWMQRVAAGLPRVPSLAFIHIPVPQFLGVWNEQPTLGSKAEGVNCPLIDTGVFQAFR